MPTFEVGRIPVEVLTETGATDSHGQAVLTESGFLLESSFFPTTGMSWEALYVLLQHPFVAGKLDEIELSGG